MRSPSARSSSSSAVARASRTTLHVLSLAFALALALLAIVMPLSRPLVVLAQSADMAAPTPSLTTMPIQTTSSSSSSDKPLACPFIVYTQALRPVTGSALIADELPQYKLTFVNHSPQHALSMLDVQYRVNDGALVNVRLIGDASSTARIQEHQQQGQLGTAPPFILRAGDRVEYRFTYKPVEAPSLTCQTPLFHVSGRDLPTISSQSSTPAVGVSHTPNIVHAAASEAHMRTTTTMATPAMPAHDMSANSQVEATTAPPVHLEETSVERNADVCPLIPFTQQIHRTPSSDPRHPYRYTLRFENLSPSLSLTFLDAHVQINDGSVANFRLFSDPSLSNKANQARALEGLPLESNDTLLYAFTYGVGTRACNTPTFKYHVEA